MKIATYPFAKSPESFYYEFYSNGPNGNIKKVVEFYRFTELKGEIFNLSFGDWNENNQCIDHLAITNNGDSIKVLSTVALTVLDFMKNYPKAAIIATGSTLSRTRLYQMGIARILEKISENFEIQGYIDDSWQIFQKGTNYAAFLLRLK